MGYKKSPTYHEMATNYNLWREYIDINGFDAKSEEEFESISYDHLIETIVLCFGAEEMQEEEPVGHL